MEEGAAVLGRGEGVKLVVVGRGGSVAGLGRGSRINGAAASAGRERGVRKISVRYEDELDDLGR